VDADQLEDAVEGLARQRQDVIGEEADVDDAALYQSRGVGDGLQTGGAAGSEGDLRPARFQRSSSGSG